MTVDEFKASFDKASPPNGIDVPLMALWYDAKGQWAKAHDMVQEQLDPDGSWAHAYLHRKEGDIANAQYWYSQAGREVSRSSIDTEWEDIVRSLLSFPARTPMTT